MPARKPKETIADPNHELVFTSLFKEHEYKLFTFAFRLTKSEQLAKDIIQEVFLKLWDHRASIHEINNIEYWLYRLTENKAIDFFRKANAEQRLRMAIWYNVREIVNDTQLQVEAREFNNIIKNAIDKLPPQRKIIYQLNRENGMNYQEIASKLKISSNTVRNQLAAAVKSLRKLIRAGLSLF